jgi:hypothetical protein
MPSAHRPIVENLPLTLALSPQAGRGDFDGAPDFVGCAKHGRSTTKRDAVAPLPAGERWSGAASARDVFNSPCPPRVMPGLVPGIHEFSKGGVQVVDARDEPVHDGWVSVENLPLTLALSPQAGRGDFDGAPDFRRLCQARPVDDETGRFRA